MHDTQERLVRGEETSPAREGVALKHTLARMFGQDLDDSSTLVPGSDIPLEVTSAVTKDGVELVGDELIGREDTEALRVPRMDIADSVPSKRRAIEGRYLLLNDFVQKLANSLHAAGFLSSLDSQSLPIRHIQRFIAVVRLLLLSKLQSVLFRDNRKDGFVGFPIGEESVGAI